MYGSVLVSVSAGCKYFDACRFVERYGAVVRYRTRNREVADSIPASTKCHVLETLYQHNLVLVSSREDPS